MKFRDNNNRPVGSLRPFPEPCVHSCAERGVLTHLVVCETKWTATGETSRRFASRVSLTPRPTARADSVPTVIVFAAVTWHL